MPDMKIVKDDDTGDNEPDFIKAINKVCVEYDVHEYSLTGKQKSGVLQIQQVSNTFEMVGMLEHAKHLILSTVGHVKK